MQKLPISHTYDELSRLTRTSYGNGVSTEYGYNAGSLLTSLTNRAPGGSVLKQYGYTYLLDGNRAAETEGNKLREYAYDKAGQLTQERLTENGAEKLKYVYGYNSAGNRTYMQKHVDGAYSDFELFINNHANRLIQTSNIDTGVANNFFYDANGNLTRRADYDDPSKYGAFTYDVLGRQTGYTDGTVSVEYDYDAEGLRTAKIADGVTTEYVTDGGKVVLELVNGTVTARYLYGLGLVHATIGADKYYYSYNGHGDVVQLTDASGNVVRSYEYDAFGNELNPTAGDNNPFRYCGEYFDTETGSYYLRARYYNPTSGRFLTEDPIRAGLNWYTYCSNNPIRFVDPSGEIPVLAIAALAVGVAALLSGCSNESSQKMSNEPYFQFKDKLTYAPEAWNDDLFKRYTNCYTYAFNMFWNPLTGERFPEKGMDPGYLSGKILKAEYLDGSNAGNDALVRLIAADMEMVGLEFVKHEEGMTGGYVVVLVVYPDTDYHFYRQDADGSWSHKQGNTQVQKTIGYYYDENGDMQHNPNPIIDPETAAAAVGYTVFVGRYYVREKTGGRK